MFWSSLFCPKRTASNRTFRPELSALEDRLVPANLVWINRGQASDRFNEVFGAQANAARAVVDAVLVSWGTVLTNLNQPAIDAPADRNTINFTISMDATRTGFGGGAAATSWAFASQQDKDANRNGHPTAGTFTLDRGENGQPNNGWWIDPTPNEHSEFTNILTPFAAARPANSVGVDLYGTINAEIAHILGLFDTAPSRLTTPVAGTITRTNLADVAHGGGRGFYYVFDGPSGTQLLTSYDSGGGGQDVGNPTHTAGPTAANYPVAFNSQYRGALRLTGSLDAGNAAGDGQTRVLPSDNIANLLKDAFGYTVRLPSTIPGMTYAVANQAGRLTVRGGPDGDGPAPAPTVNARVGGSGASFDTFGAPYYDTSLLASSDHITFRRDGSNLVITIDYGRDGPVGGLDPDGDGDAPAFVTRVPIGSFTTLFIDTDGGDDVVTFDFTGGNFLPSGGVVFAGDLGADELIVIGGGAFDLRSNVLYVAGIGRVDMTSVSNVTLIGVAGPDAITVRNWSGNVNVNGAGGNDIITLTGTIAATRVTVHGGAGNDLIYGSPNAEVIYGDDGDDTIYGGGGNDLMLGGVGNDLLVGSGVLIGGLGRDVLIGGGSLFIGGTTAYDDSPAQLLSIQTLWGRTDLSYAQRVSQLRAGGPNGAFALNSATVRDDRAIDVMTGLFTGLNWFFSLPLDWVLGRKVNEQVN